MADEKRIERAREFYELHGERDPSPYGWIADFAESEIARYPNPGAAAIAEQIINSLEWIEGDHPRETITEILERAYPAATHLTNPDARAIAENITARLNAHGWFSQDGGFNLTDDDWNKILEGITAILTGSLPRWIPVSERLPEHKEGWPSRVLITFAAGEYRDVSQARFYKGEWIGADGRLLAGPEVTHWQPLPEPYQPDVPIVRSVPKTRMVIFALIVTSRMTFVSAHIRDFVLNFLRNGKRFT